MSKPLNKIPLGQLYSVTMMLLKRQDGKCLVCGRAINVKTQGRSSDYAADHDHKSGEIRGVLHRACNSVEGKVRHAISRWGGTGSDELAMIEHMEGLAKYLRECHEGTRTTGLEYPDHKSPEQKAEAARLKRNKQYAAKKAAEAMAKRKQVEK